MDYDLIVVGGGLAGASLAKNMAEKGASVLVLERETVFKDRIRGEAMHPWGVAEAQALGIYQALHDTCGHVANRWKVYFNGEMSSDRDLPRTSPHEHGEFHFYHPAMQETVIGLARSAGADVRRGARLSTLDIPNKRVTFKESGETVEASARLIVGADGSRSMVRRLAGFEVQEDDDRLMLAGVMMDNSSIPEDSVHQFQGPDGLVILFPQGNARTRSYIAYAAETGDRALIGEDQKFKYLEICRHYGVPESWLKGVELTGPLAQFHGADRWADHPASDGVVLVGDAAAKPDPSWGTGLSLSLLDVRTLRDELLATPGDWNGAIHRYADKHDRYYKALHTVEKWFTDLMWDQGEAADARRTRVIPMLEQPGAPDFIGLGPESPLELKVG